ncbi:NAD(P)-binding domain-containing protein [Leucobacter insecticola]|uniref:NAD(P)-binding domain-containing protein n=1 Tax=Leucobacter insecticola TaxID=2714934 RepID=A0A6G8FGL4_9MICO|nr:NAD(P)-binding domain-containing protein [Leucobacter insecticola]QIM15413.1 NAD(P)-binding domain-containing protein [Leucobacter insecticola]
MTSISIIGSGKMSAAIAAVATRAGASIQILRRSTTSSSGDHPDITYGAIGDDLTGDLVVLAVPYVAYPSILAHYREQLGEKVVVDISNPIDFTTYDQLMVPADSSTAAELVKQLPEGAAVVKAFNVNLGDTLTAGTNGTTVTTVLFAGDYAEAKMAVAALVEGAGMRAIDVGPLTRARELEAMGFLQIALSALGKTRNESGFTLLD